MLLGPSQRSDERETRVCLTILVTCVGTPPTVVDDFL
jgi:hypothetical protein